MRRRVVLLFFCCLAVSLCNTAGAAVPEAGGKGEPLPPPIVWQDLEPGLALARIPLPGARAADPAPALPELSPGNAADASAQPPPVPQPESRESAEPPPVAVFLRFDPERYTLSLHMASDDKPRSLPELAERHNLVAAINAGMYLPDKRTSTGHMRNATHVNNPRVMEKFGAFLVAQPREAGLPRIRLLDRVEDDWKKALERYDLVVQNYRLNNVQGKVLWSASGPPHSIAALSQDASGSLYFILCPDPAQPALFAAALLRLPLGLRTIMYLEGGSQAALLVRTGDVEQVWVGRHASGLWDISGHPDAALPNVLGLRPRAGGE